MHFLGVKTGVLNAAKVIKLACGVNTIAIVPEGRERQSAMYGAVESTRRSLPVRGRPSCEAIEEYVQKSEVIFIHI